MTRRVEIEIMRPTGQAYTRAQVYQLERDSIRAFVASHEFHGRVLDYGCGQSPYRDLVERTAAEYVPWDRAGLPGGSGGDIGARNASWGEFDEILCTQVIQYVPNPELRLTNIADALEPGARLVLTGPSCWHEEEPKSLWRFTKAGIRGMLENAGFTVERLEDRATLDLGGFPLSLGWGVVARA